MVHMTSVTWGIILYCNQLMNPLMLSREALKISGKTTDMWKHGTHLKLYGKNLGACFIPFVNIGLGSQLTITMLKLMEWFPLPHSHWYLLMKLNSCFQKFPSCSMKFSPCYMKSPAMFQDFPIMFPKYPVCSVKF